MVIMKTAYKYHAYPSIEQKEILNRQMFLAKEIYNMLLEKSKAYHKETGKNMTRYRMNNWLTQIKKEKPEFTELHSHALQDISKRISDACVHFFRRSKEKKHGKKINIGFQRYKMQSSERTFY
ncbi:helix-turn-helix domain-containing protein, partial [Candidatus Marsarchaeota archaeon]|nr:helix-turn-helix domain-containing protein [Candidatus Marsarchaeota archaeon]